MDYLGAKNNNESLAAQIDIPKLYTATGDNEDGTMTQKAITEALSGGGGGETEELIFEGSVSKTANQTITMPRTFGEYRYIVISVRERVTPTTLPSKTSAQNNYYALQMTPRIRIDEEMLLNSASYSYYSSRVDYYASQIGIPVLELTAGVSPKVTSAPHYFFLTGRVSGINHTIEDFLEWLRGYNQFALYKATSNADITTKTVIYRITGVLK